VELIATVALLFVLSRMGVGGVATSEKLELSEGGSRDTQLKGRREEPCRMKQEVIIYG
jgi:hypothetical protein